MTQIRPEIITIGNEDCVETLNAFHACLCKYNPAYKGTNFHKKVQALLKECHKITFANKVHTFFTGHRYKNYIEVLAFDYTLVILTHLKTFIQYNYPNHSFEKRNGAWGIYVDNRYN